MNQAAHESHITEYVTAMIGGQLFGLPISKVQDVFMPERMARVPLASAEVAGVLNLRGRRGARTSARRWRSASICAASPMGF